MAEQLQNPQLRETQQDPLFTCEICMEPISKTQQFNNTPKCSHRFCRDCTAKYIELKIKDKTGGGNIPCPGFNCQTHLDPVHCREVICPNLFVEWCDVLVQRAIPWPDSSYCPNSNCLELVVNECGGLNLTVKKSKCPNCKELFCFECKRKWENCDEKKHRCSRNGDIRDMNDVLFMRLMKKKKWVKCPGCGHCIERHDGCPSVKCSRCLTGFCYGCGRKICQCKPQLGFRLQLMIILFGLFFMFIGIFYICSSK